MKVFAACLCLLLTIAILSTQLFAQPVSVSIPVTCCFNMVPNRIPRQNLRKYTIVNNSYCPKEAVIFKTWLGREVCANPKEKWVQTAMKHLDQKSKRSKV